MTEILAPHLGGHMNKTHVDAGALEWLISNGAKSFLDIGCGPGGMVELATEKGLTARGIDGDHTIPRFNIDSFIIHDYTTGPIVVVEDKYDVIWSV